MVLDNHIHNMLKAVATKILLFTPWAGVTVMPHWANRPRWLLCHVKPPCRTALSKQAKLYIDILMATGILVLLSKQDLAEYGHTSYANYPLSW
jgi:hypothetical protein